MVLGHAYGLLFQEVAVVLVGLLLAGDHLVELVVDVLPRLFGKPRV
jgi:hypothetical protein